MISVKNLTVKVASKELIRDVTFSINKGEIAFLLGSNGAGKSSLAKAIIGFPGFITDGNVTINDTNISSLSTDQKVRQGKVFYSHQTPIEIDGVNYLEFLRTIYNNSQPDDLHLDTWMFLEKFNELANEVGIDSSFANRELNVNFSGGEKKKSEILQMLLMKPNFAILDEIDSGLDVDITSQIYKIIKATANKEDTSFLIITHNPSILKHIKPDKVFILENGSLINTGDYTLAEDTLKNGFKKS
jgi:Fe-S cluster assembly ATP-binding protein